MSVTQLIFDTPKQARLAKNTFGSDYGMYCSYLSQFNHSGNRLVPLSHIAYNSI